MSVLVDGFAHQNSGPKIQSIPVQGNALAICFPIYSKGQRPDFIPAQCNALVIGQIFLYLRKDLVFCTS